MTKDTLKMVMAAMADLKQCKRTDFAEPGR